MIYNITNRAVVFAQYIVATKSTIRQTAKVYGISKSTVHNDLSKKLKYISKDLYKQVQIILQYNFENKHIKGGESTRNKYKHKIV